jgi:beta-lactamase class A
VTASYTRTSKGLQALINDWVKNHKGSYNIAMRTTAGDISASYNAGGKIYPASIYKLFVADVAYTKAANGQLDLNTPTSTGQTIDGCIELMIVRSDNNCAYAVGDAIGWDANNGFLASQGFGSTTLKQHVWTTNANDILNLLLKLQNGSLIDANYTSALLSKMSRQIYRSGIPAGSAGAVADKVGFVDNYNHDAGIVYHPNGTYALVIMTTNSNFSNIADLARQISNVMKQ